MATKQKPVMVLEGEHALALWPLVSNPEKSVEWRLRTVRGPTLAGGIPRMTGKQKIVEYGVNRPITIKLPDKYWDVLFCMAEMQGRTVEDLATERLKQIIREDVDLSLHEEGYYGQLLIKGWQETLKGDPYYEGKE